MAISFEKVINLTTYEGNTAPKVVEQLSIVHEATKGELVQYYIDPKSKSEGDKNTYAIGVYDEKTKEYTYVDYDEVLWNKPKKRITSQKIDRLGLKAFPGIGAIAFYKLAYRNTSRILAPVNTKSNKYNAPTFTMEETDTTFIFHCSSPKDVTYVCYRIILRLDKFAHEYITYEETLEVPKPATTGTYDIYCVGYVHEGEAVSEDSKHYSVDVVGTQEDWPGPMEGSDLFITDVEVTEENKVHIRRSDGFQKDSDNVIPVPVSATFLEDGKLAITLSNGDTVVTDNASPGGAAPSTPTNLCDNVPYNMWCSGTSFYTGSDAEAGTYSYVIPINPGKTYRITIVTPGNRSRWATSAIDPRGAAANTVTGINSGDKGDNPAAGLSWVYTAAANETFLTLYYTNKNDQGVEYTVYEI